MLPRGFACTLCLSIYFLSNQMHSKLNCNLSLSLLASFSFNSSISLPFAVSKGIEIDDERNGGAARKILDWRVKQPASRLCVGAHCRLYTRSYPGSLIDR